MHLFHRNRNRLRIPIAIVVLVIAAWIFIPIGNVFPDCYSTVVFDRNCRLLRAFLAADEQMRFPSDTAVFSAKYYRAVLTQEDRRFEYHPGVDPLALLMAVWDNIRAGKTVRGGSTLPMQVARLAKPKSRTYFNKLRECCRALRLSFHLSKKELFKLYADHVPMGGNIVGLEAASYCYFNKSPAELTWAEAALFAVLPNAPSMINLGSRRERLVHKRNRLLQKLRDAGELDSLSYSLACREPLPPPEPNLPFVAPHFTRMVAARHGKDYRLVTSLDSDIQNTVEAAVKVHHRRLAVRGIPNLAALVVETSSGAVRAYVGSQRFADTAHGGQVDGVQAFRSTGSLLKPFLVAKALDRGPYSMKSLVQDVPTFFGTFAPQNASEQFCGMAPLEKVLISSLNVPSVRLLNAYGVDDFYEFLVDAGLKGLFRSPSGYGLTLILGGAEAGLWEMTAMYRSLGMLGQQGRLATTNRNVSTSVAQTNDTLMSQGAAWLVLETLKQVRRPGIEQFWDSFETSVPVAWKTGTSYGQKDGWAIGTNAQWTVGVWAGNFTGEGNAELSGSRSAAPLLFTLFNTLTQRDRPVWPQKPEPKLDLVACCALSGYQIGKYCPETTFVEMPSCAYRHRICPYHRRFLIDRRTGRSVCSLCWDNVDTAWVTRAIYPPAARKVLVQTGHVVDSIPLHAHSCPTATDPNRLQLVYPVPGVKLFVPRGMDGAYQKVVFEARHQRSNAHLFWYLDGNFVAETEGIHTPAIDLPAGHHTVVVQDEEGFLRTVSFWAFRR
ncbi:MAG: penicillin-binding protein 1C [Chitinivibrionales bacterium]|nr:penicillin-binding protein 1C [Chitinivibrionales bacterium]